MNKNANVITKDLTPIVTTNGCGSSSDSILDSARRRMRHAWITLGAYVFIRIFLAAWFEYRAYKDSVINFGVLEFFGALLLTFVLIASFVTFVRLAFKRAFAPALIYAFIVLWHLMYLFTLPHVHIRSFVMETKAHIFAAYPNLCQTPIVPGKRVSICYKYSVNETGGEYEQIYFNPGDEMSLPPRQWPVDIKREFLGVRATREDLFEEELCGLRKTRRIVDHVYWIDYDCWGY
jgi:hypothetical protein